MTRLTLDDVRQARTQIRNFVRTTSLLAAGPEKDPLPGAGVLTLKLECLQVAG